MWHFTGKSTPIIFVSYQKFGFENIHAGSIRRTDQFVFNNIYVCSYMHAEAVSVKEVMN